MKRTVIHRKGTPRSRNGCQTCKVRRIKCDETRPVCIRCSSTGRNCDGYAGIIQSRYFKLLDPCTTILCNTDLSFDRMELRSLRFFTTQTTVDIAGHFDSPLWIKLALKSSHTEPAVRFAATALGSLHEKLEFQNSIANLSGRSQLIDIDFPIWQYTKALEAIRALLDRSDTRSIELVLISCIICIYYEILQNNYGAAWTHLEKALKVMKRPWLKSHTGPTSISRYYSWNLLPISEDLIQAFARLDVQASSYLSLRTPRLLTEIALRDMPAQFASLNEAREALNKIVGRLQYFIRSTASRYRYDAPEFIPIQVFNEADRIKLLLHKWASSFSVFLTCSSTDMTYREQKGSKVLLIQQKVAYIKTCTCLYSHDGNFDNFDDDFAKIVSDAQFLVDHDQHMSSSRSSLSLDMAIIEALFGTAIKCRSHNIRCRAATLLRRINWREGIWDATVMSKLADQLIAEGEVFSDVDNLELPRKSGSRHADDIGFTIDRKKRHVKIFCNSPLNSMNGNRSEQYEFLTW